MGNEVKGSTERHRRLRQRLELWSAVMLAAATVATAFSAYQATRWSGVQATRFTEAGAARTESAKANTEAANLFILDAALFTAWAAAFSEDNERLEQLLIERLFRGQFSDAFLAWFREARRELEVDEAGEFRTTGDAPVNPFDTDDYELEGLEEEVEQLEARAEERFEQGRTANQSSDNYVLATIFFAAVLFFGGLGSKFTSNRIAIATLAFGSLVFVVGVVRVVTLPFH